MYVKGQWLWDKEKRRPVQYWGYGFTNRKYTKSFFVISEFAYERKKYPKVRRLVTKRVFKSKKYPRILSRFTHMLSGEDNKIIL